MANQQNTSATERFLNSSDGRVLSVGHSTVNWGAIFAGLFVGLIVYAGLMCLGLAVGGGSLQNVIQGEEGARGLGFGAGLWTVVATIISLYFAGHVSGRVAGIISTRVGRIQGGVIASLFFLLMFTQLGLMMGALSGGLGSALSSIGAGMNSAVTSPLGQEMIEDAVGNLNLKTPPADVARGVGVRLLRGDEDSAVTYLANQSGLNPDDARARLETFKAKFNESARTAAIMATRTARIAGVTVFFGILFGVIAGMVGGGVGANYNLRAPVSMVDAKALRAQPTPSRA